MDNKNMLIIVALLVIFVGPQFGFNIFSIFSSPTVSCTLLPEGSTNSECIINAVLPENKTFDKAIIGVAGQSKESGWIGPTGVVLSNPVISGSSFICQNDDTETCKRYYAYAIPSLPVGYNQWKLDGTLVASYTIRAATTTGKDAWAGFDIFLNGQNMCGTDFTCPLFNARTTRIDDIRHYEGESCMYSNPGSSGCRDDETITRTFLRQGTSQTFQAEYRLSSQDRGYSAATLNGGSTEVQPLFTNVMLSYTKTLTPTDTTIYVNELSVANQIGVIGTGFVTSDLASVLNTYCNRGTSKSKCTIPLKIKAANGGVISLTETDIILSEIAVTPVTTQTTTQTNTTTTTTTSGGGGGSQPPTTTTTTSGGGGGGSQPPVLQPAPQPQAPVPVPPIEEESGSGFIYLVVIIGIVYVLSRKKVTVVHKSGK